MSDLEREADPDPVVPGSTDEEHPQAQREPAIGDEAGGDREETGDVNEGGGSSV